MIFCMNNSMNKLRKFFKSMMIPFQHIKVRNILLFLDENTDWCTLVVVLSRRCNLHSLWSQTELALARDCKKAWKITQASHKIFRLFQWNVSFVKARKQLMIIFSECLTSTQKLVIWWPHEFDTLCSNQEYYALYWMLAGTPCNSCVLNRDRY